MTLRSRTLAVLRTLVRPNVTIAPPPDDAHVERDAAVTMRDGTVLRVNVFRPSTPGPVPVILSAHPYGKDKIPANTRSGRGPSLQFRLIPQPHAIRISAWTSWEAPDPAFWVRHGYAVVNADLRGGGTSEGVGALFSDAEADDYCDLIAWAGTQPWSSGRVGLDAITRSKARTTVGIASMPFASRSPTSAPRLRSSFTRTHGHRAI